MKRIFYLLIFALLLTVNPLTIKANENYCYNLKASVGASATEVGFNWHSSVSGTKLYLSENSDMSNATIYTPSEQLYSKGMTNGQAETVFAERTVCQVNASNLKTNTIYYYQVKYESYASEICKFKTTRTDKTTFGVLCDTQASGSNFKNSDQLVSKLYSINNDINFFMIAGDIVDRGGFESEWNNFDKYMPVLNHQFLQATIPGNHELYHSSLSSYVDASIYNKYYNNPKNGCAERLNSSYYFKYNNVLFIMLDTMTRSSGKNYYAEQIAWMKEVVMNNPTMFKVVVTHPGCYSTGVYDHDATIMKGNWRNVFEELGIDLAISGHEHLYARTPQIYQDKKDTEKGTTYVIGGSAGQKSYDAENTKEFEVVLETNNPNGQYCGSIVEIKGDTLTFSYYGINGELRDQFEIKSKVKDTSDFNIDEFLNSVHVEFNEKTYKNSIIWADNAYGNIKTIDVYVEHLDLNVNKYIAPGAVEMNVGNGTPSKDYKYVCTFTDYNNEKHVKTLIVDNDPESMMPTDFVITITENPDNSYTASYTYTPNKAELMFLYLHFNGKEYRFKENGELTFTSNEPVNKEDITISAFVDLFGSSAMHDVPEDELTINVTNLDTPNDKENKMNCNFGLSFISSFILCGALLVLITKRK